MNTHTIKTYLLAYVYEGSSKVRYCVSECEMKSVDGYTVIAEQEVTYEVPAPTDETALVVATLEKQRDSMRAEMSARIIAKDEQIASFLALENNNADS